jgi:hypothetical protein
MAEPRADDVLDHGPPGLIDFPYGGRAHILDEEAARTTPCLCRELKDGSVCFSEGAVGPLDDEQRALFCAVGEEPLVLTEEQAARLQQFADAAAHCRIEVVQEGDANETEPYLACMKAELRRRDAAAI